MKRFSFILGMSLLLAGAPSVAAVGSPVERFHDHFEETFLDDPTTTDDDFCGEIPVTTHFDFTQNGIVRLDTAGHQLFKVSGHIIITWTNPANGLSITDLVSGAFRDIRITDNPDGTTTFYGTNVGVPERLQTPDKTVLVKDVGRIVFATTIDFNDPDNPDDDVFISGEIVSIAGPHPEAESDFALFCEVGLDALT
jgi:hypothetical protein